VGYNSCLPETFTDIFALYNLSFHTQACKKCCQFIDCQRTLLTDYVDGKNLEAALTEFGIRIHRHLLDHLQQFQYNSMGKIR
jgi:recyclin-1